MTPAPPRTNWLTRKIRVLFATRFAEMAEYRAEVIIWMLSGTLSIVMMLVWMAQAQGSPDGTVNGYAPHEFATYFISTWFVSQLLVVWVAWELDTKSARASCRPNCCAPWTPCGTITPRTSPSALSALCPCWRCWA